MPGIIVAPALAQPLLNFFFRGVSPSALPSSLYWSLGWGDATSLAELTGMERVAVPRYRGAFGGHAAASPEEYPYQSTGLDIDNSVMLHPCYLRVPSSYGRIVHTVGGTGLHILVYNAASGGNLLLASRVNDNLDGSNLSAFYGGDVLQIHRSVSHPVQTRITGAAAPGIYLNCMVHDWLFRGYGSLEQLFSVASYPNIYWRTNYNNTTYSDYSALARNTSNWSAPANGSGYMTTKITNAVALNTPAFATGYTTQAGYMSWVEFALAPPQTGYDLFLVSVGKTTSSYTIVAGDTVQLPINSLDIVVGWK